MKLTLKNVKVIKLVYGEAVALCAAVYIDGKKAGVARNNGNGEENYVDWTDYGLSARYLAWLNKETMVREDPIDSEKIWIVEAESKLGLIISEALAEFEEQEFFKTACRNRTLFRLKSDPHPEAWRSVKAAFDNGVKAWLQTRYGDDLGEIANETRI